jgi:hypothetical protein
MREYSEVTSGEGYLTASVNVEVTDIWGHPVIKRVCVGRVHGVSLQDARSMVAKARDNNSNQHVQATFKVSL